MVKVKADAKDFAIKIKTGFNHPMVKVKETMDDIKRLTESLFQPPYGES